MLTFTIIIILLVVVNFLLLYFSSNKAIQPVKENRELRIIKPNATKQLVSSELAPTGS